MENENKMTKTNNNDTNIELKEAIEKLSKSIEEFVEVNAVKDSSEDDENDFTSVDQKLATKINTSDSNSEDTIADASCRCYCKIKEKIKSLCRC